MKTRALSAAMVVIAIVGLTHCSASMTTIPPQPITVAISQFPPLTMANNSTALVAATVANDTAGVNWSCTPVGSCGTFNPTGTASEATTIYTAPASAAMVTIIATSVTDSSQSASTGVDVTSNFTFYLSGLETGTNFYAVAGTASIDSEGTVINGETEYNDADGITSGPGPDDIVGGALTVDDTGQGTLMLITSNPSVGVGGTETLGIQYVNANHALIVQFDGTATSSGSLDFQTIPTTLGGSFAFALSGVTPTYVLGSREVSNSLVTGGVFTTDGVNVTNGKADVNSGGTLVHGTAFTGTLTGPDAFGRGTITTSFTDDQFSFYIVGPEVIRIIDVDAGDSAVGSAYGQGDTAGGFGDSTLGSAVFEAQSNSLGFLYDIAGELHTDVMAGTYAGVADTDEQGVVARGSAISGAYEIASNGYGQITITNGGAEDVTVMGMYMTDPTLNLLDPNNTTSGLGGALLVDIDTTLNGTGVLLPQSDTVTGDFAGTYTLGAQMFDVTNLTIGWEVDFVGNGTVTAGTLSGTALVSDPFFTLSETGENSGVAIAGTAVPDGVNPGRYTINDFSEELGSPTYNARAVVYQASGDQLLWIGYGEFSTFAGSLQQEPEAAGGGVRRARVTKKTKSH
jgi:hypothetical protein